MGPEFISAADRDGKNEVQFREHTHQFRRATFGCMNHIQNPPTAIRARQSPTSTHARKLRPDRTSNYPNSSGPDAAPPYHPRPFPLPTAAIIAPPPLPRSPPSTP